jgi:hypothetical protein
MPLAAYAVGLGNENSTDLMVAESLEYWIDTFRCCTLQRWLRTKPSDSHD